MAEQSVRIGSIDLCVRCASEGLPMPHNGCEHAAEQALDLSIWRPRPENEIRCMRPITFEDVHDWACNIERGAE